LESSETTRRLTELDRDLIERRVRRMVELRADGNISGMLEFAAPDIVYTNGSWKHYPFNGRREGKAAVGEMGRQINIFYENLGSTINKLLIDGDRVALHRTASIRNRGTGKSVSVDIWNFLRFRDGLIVEFSEYPDTQAFASIGAPD
jgi:ketosteroid isomerase-like protein